MVTAATEMIRNGRNRYVTAFNFLNPPKSTIAFVFKQSCISDQLPQEKEILQGPSEKEISPASLHGSRRQRRWRCSSPLSRRRRPRRRRRATGVTSPAPVSGRRPSPRCSAPAGNSSRRRIPSSRAGGRGTWPEKLPRSSRCCSG